MRNPCLLVFALLFPVLLFGQKTKVPPKRYPSLLWEISGRGMPRPSYLFGTMHVSSKMVFHLSDSFYLGIRNADVVALETDMGSWQEDFSRYEMGEGAVNYLRSLYREQSDPNDYLSRSTLAYPDWITWLEGALSAAPSMINSFLYRTYSERTADLEEDTYLDLHIYQAGRKWGKKVCGVERFDESMQLMREAYVDAAKEKDKKKKNFDYDADFSYARLEEAYRTGNLDLLDTINKLNSRSAAFDEKFLYRRNEIQAASIDSILRKKQRLFVGVGAAHLPGERGVIEMLRRMGYTLRPIRMTERDSRHKDEVERLRVPVSFSRQTVPDGAFSVSLPGKLYDFGGSAGLVRQFQYADMSNGSYYTITRIATSNPVRGLSEGAVLRKVDSVLYENVPGKMLSKRPIERNGYKGFEIANRTRRGDHQRYQIYATPFEVLVFKMSGNGEYVNGGKEAAQFFGSIELRPVKVEWKKWTPAQGGFEAEFPHTPQLVQDGSLHYQAVDPATRQGFDVMRTDVHQYDFVEEDTFDLALMEESFASSDFIDKNTLRRHGRLNGYPCLDAAYTYRDGSVARVRFLIQGPHYYTVVARGPSDHSRLEKFVQSFGLRPFQYPASVVRVDTTLKFSVRTPVPLRPEEKLSMYPEELIELMRGESAEEGKEELREQSLTVSSDSTGEKIIVTKLVHPRYYYFSDSSATDTLSFHTHKMVWKYRMRRQSRLADSTYVLDYILGDSLSSRYVRGKYVSRKGLGYRLETAGDTLSGPSAFVREFFDSFSITDTAQGYDPEVRKSAMYFSDLFSGDSTRRRKAMLNVGMMRFDTADFARLERGISTLTWKDRPYLETKKGLITALGQVPTPASADYLGRLYRAAGDTVELQYAALEGLLLQRNKYAYRVFRDIMVSDPPVLDAGSRSYRGASSYAFGIDFPNGEFLDNLSDSLQLTAGIMKDLLPLTGVSDYEEPLLKLMGELVDSNLLRAADYESYLPKLLIEGKQLLKKQLIGEKRKSIQEAQKEGDDESNQYRFRDNEGESDLSLYARLLLPFWDRNPSVPQFMNGLLSSNSKELKYETAMLLLRSGRKLPDTLWNYFAGDHEYRFELYEDLHRQNKLALFPKAYEDPLLLARSLLVRGEYNPDTAVFLQKLPAANKGRSGWVYFFRYKNDRDDAGWKIGMAGLLPEKAPFLWTGLKQQDDPYVFVDLTQEKLDESEPVLPQLQTLLKKSLYKERNSAIRFYSRENDFDYRMLRQLRD